MQNSTLIHFSARDILSHYILQFLLERLMQYNGNAQVNNKGWDQVAAKNSA